MEVIKNEIMLSEAQSEYIIHVPPVLEMKAITDEVFPDKLMPLMVLVYRYSHKVGKWYVYKFVGGRIK